jgi:DNA-binding response OmpR family regulator
MKKILIVEDDPLVANIYRNRFAREGFQVKIALDGLTGLDLARSFQPDAVILDLLLPKLTGIELTRRIRAESNLARVPIIVVSKACLTSMMQRAREAGATQCLSKDNFTPKQVLDELRLAFSPNGDGAPAALPAAEEPETAPPAVRPDDAAAHPLPPSPAQGASDEEFQAELGRALRQNVPHTLETLRGLLRQAVKTEPQAARLKLLKDLERRVHALATDAGLAGMSPVTQMADTLQALLKELQDKPQAINPSTLRTLALALDGLACLFEHGQTSGPQPGRPPSVLVVDDEAISRRAVVYALDKAGLKSTAADNPAVALELLSREQFELVILDVDMPIMNGFELCTRLRALPGYHDTPVVFVTSFSDFNSRTSSTISGGNDFIAKPFLFMELALKALVHVLRGRPQARNPVSRPP